MDLPLPRQWPIRRPALVVECGRTTPSVPVSAGLGPNKKISLSGGGFHPFRGGCFCHFEILEYHVIEFVSRLVCGRQFEPANEHFCQKKLNVVIWQTFSIVNQHNNSQLTLTQEDPHSQAPIVYTPTHEFSPCVTNGNFDIKKPICISRNTTKPS